MVTLKQVHNAARELERELLSRLWQLQDSGKLPNVTFLRSLDSDFTYLIDLPALVLTQDEFAPEAEAVILTPSGLFRCTLRLYHSLSGNTSNYPDFGSRRSAGTATWLRYRQTIRQTLERLDKVRKASLI